MVLSCRPVLIELDEASLDAESTVGYLYSASVYCLILRIRRGCLEEELYTMAQYGIPNKGAIVKENIRGLLQFYTDVAMQDLSRAI